MKKVFVILICNLFTISTFAQEFLGIKVDGKRQEVINKFIAKGFKVTSQKGSSNVVAMEGKVNDTNIELNIVNSPTTSIVWKFAIYLPKQDSWYSIKSQYNSYLNTLTEKYGEPTNSYNNFINPYYEGDGYEMSAIAIDKCNFISFWNNGTSIKISKFKQVQISYENAINSAIDDEEKKALNNKIFK